MAHESNRYQVDALDLYTFTDLDQLAPGEAFEVTWGLRNNGENTWTGDFEFVYTDESYPDTLSQPHINLAEKERFSLSELGAAAEVTPGDTAYLTLQMIAPEEPGDYVSGWQLQSPQSERFGPPVEIRVIVVEPAGKGFDDLVYQPVRYVPDPGVANRNSMKPGEAFTGTWILRNTSLTPWEGDFRVVYTSAGTPSSVAATSDRMGTQPSYSLWELIGAQRVEPGEQISVPLNFVAPKQPGHYAYHWQMVAPGGVPFGGTRWMSIIVAEPNGTAPEPPAAPTGGVGYAYRGPQVTFFTGIHGPADDWRWKDSQMQNMIRQLNMPVFFMSHGINPDFAGMGDPARNVVRLVWNPRPASADDAYVEIRDDQLRRWWNLGYRKFVFFNEPQLTEVNGVSKEGFGTAWHSKEEFAQFLKTCLVRAKQDFPGIFLYTTPMTSNVAFAPWQWRSAMWSQVNDLVDGWCMHAYSGDNVNADAAAQSIANEVVDVQRRFGLQIPIIVSEASVNRGHDAAQKARVARLLPSKLAHVPGIQGVFWFAADWAEDQDENHEGWLRRGIANHYMAPA